MNVLQIIIKATSGNSLKTLNAINSSIRTLTSVSASAATAVSLLAPQFRNLRFIITDFGNAITSVISLIGELISLAVSLVTQLLSVFTFVFGKIIDVAKAAMGTVASIVADTMKGVAVAVLNAGKEAGKNWLQFERESDRIFGLIANEAGVSFEQIKRMSLRLSTQLGKDIQGIQEALFAVISAGFRDVAEAGEVVFQAGQLAKAGWIEVGDTIEPIISIINAYGLAAKDAERVAALMFETQVRGRGTMQEFAKLLGQVLPIAKALNITMEDAAAATAAVTRTMGAQGRVMFSTVSALNQLAAPTKSAAAAWKQMGFDITRATDGTIDLKESIADLAEVVKRDPDILKKMFPQRAGLRGASISIEQLKHTIDFIRNGVTSLENFGAAVQSTEIRMGFLLERGATLWKNLGIVIVDVLQAAAQPLLEDILGLLDEFGNKLVEVVDAGKFDQFEEDLKLLVIEFRKSEIWRFILENFERLLDAIIQAIETIIDLVHEWVEEGLTLERLNTIFATMSTWATTVQTNWSAAFAGMSSAARQLWRIMRRGLDEVNIDFNELITVTIPAFIAALQSINIAQVVAGWIAAFQTLIPAMEAVALKIISIFESMLNAARAVINQIAMETASLQLVMSGVSTLTEIDDLEKQMEQLKKYTNLIKKAQEGTLGDKSDMSVEDRFRLKIAPDWIEQILKDANPAQAGVDKLQELSAKHAELINAYDKVLAQSEQGLFPDPINLDEMRDAVRGAATAIDAGAEALKNGLEEVAEAAQRQIEADLKLRADQAAEAVFNADADRMNALPPGENLAQVDDHIDAIKEAAYLDYANTLLRLSEQLDAKANEALARVSKLNLGDGISQWERDIINQVSNEIKSLRLSGREEIMDSFNSLQEMPGNLQDGPTDDIVRKAAPLIESINNTQGILQDIQNRGAEEHADRAASALERLGSGRVQQDTGAAFRIQEMTRRKNEERERIRNENKVGKTLEEARKRREEIRNRSPEDKAKKLEETRRRLLEGRETTMDNSGDQLLEAQNSVDELRKLNRSVDKLTPVYIGSIG